MKNLIARMLYLKELKGRIAQARSVYCLARIANNGTYYKQHCNELIAEFNMKKFFYMKKEEGLL